MDEVHVCDIVLQSAPWSIDAGTRARVDRKLADLAAYATRLVWLQLGELTWRLVPGDKVLMLRLSLVPRRQGWLFDPMAAGGSRPRTIADEAEAAFAQLQQAQVRIARVASDFERRGREMPTCKLDPVALAVFRQSGRQWLLRRGATEVQWVFPQIEDYLVDEQPVEVRGVVSLITARRIELVRVSAPASIGAIGKLTITRQGSDDAAWQTLPQVETPLRAELRLHRCVLTRLIIGGDLVRVLPWNQPRRSVRREALPRKQGQY